MIGLTEDELRRLGELHLETLPDFWRRLRRERGAEVTAADIAKLKAMDTEQHPSMARRDREECRYD